MRIDWSTLALQLVNFALLVWLLQRLLYRPVLKVVDARRAQAEARYDDAARAQEAAKQQLSEIALKRAGIAAECAAALERAQEQAREMMEARRAQGKRDALALLDEARGKIAQEREQLLEEARASALDLAVEMARRLLAQVPESMPLEGWLERIDRHLRSLPSADQEALTRELSAGGAVAVVTALPLPADAQERWRARLRESLGPHAAIDFESDPRLISGAELNFPSATLRFSVQSVLEALKEEAGRRGEPR